MVKNKDHSKPKAPHPPLLESCALRNGASCTMVKRLEKTLLAQPLNGQEQRSGPICPAAHQGRVGLVRDAGAGGPHLLNHDLHHFFGDLGGQGIGHIERDLVMEQPLAPYGR